MTKEIIVAVVAALVGSLITVVISASVGLFEKRISDSQIEEVSRVIIDEQSLRGVLLDRMRASGEFQGAVGLRGPQGERGAPGPEKNLVCITTDRVRGRVANCPTGYLVTGCSAGGNRGSIRHEEKRCVTDSADTDWTEARCCTLR